MHLSHVIFLTGHTEGKSLEMEGLPMHVAIAVAVGAIIGSLVNIFVG